MHITFQLKPVRSLDSLRPAWSGRLRHGPPPSTVVTNSSAAFPNQSHPTTPCPKKVMCHQFNIPRTIADHNVIPNARQLPSPNSFTPFKRDDRSLVHSFSNLSCHKNQYVNTTQSEVSLPTPTLPLRNHHVPNNPLNTASSSTQAQVNIRPSLFSLW